MLVVLSLGLAFGLVVLKAIAVDEVRGLIERRVRASLEVTIASLPPEVQAAWADEWRAELDATLRAPITAARFVRGIRQTASELVGEPALAGVGAVAAPGRSSLREIGRHVSSLIATGLVLTAGGGVAAIGVAWAVGGVSGGVGVSVIGAVLVGVVARCSRRDVRPHLTRVTTMAFCDGQARTEMRRSAAHYAVRALTTWVAALAAFCLILVVVFDGLQARVLTGIAIICVASWLTVLIGRAHVIRTCVVVLLAATCDTVLRTLVLVTPIDAMPIAMRLVLNATSLMAWGMVLGGGIVAVAHKPGFAGSS